MIREQHVVAEQPPGFDNQEPSSPLPRGRRGMSPEEVASHQRERVILGVATILAERGYGKLTVESIIAAARISRTTFYELFANKQEATLYAQETLFKRLLVEVRRACDGQEEWPQKVKAAIGTTLDFAEARPAQGQLLAAEFLAGDPVLAVQARESHDDLADLLGEGRRLYPKTPELPPLTEQALIGALRSQISRALDSREGTRIAELRPQLAELILIPYLGIAKAAAVAEAR